MTEAEWLGCADLGKMLEFLQGKASDRKLRLFACACCRASSDVFEQDEVWRAVYMAERYADGLATRAQLQAARRRAAGDLARSLCYLSAWPAAWRAAVLIANLAARRGLREDKHSFGTFLRRYKAALRKGFARQCPLLRDIFGKPFRPASLDPAWRTPTVRKLAEAIYADRAFNRLPILADALEEAGCDDAEVLAHCRSGGEHVRGCWLRFVDCQYT
jgi:hypothetical protein